MNILNFFFSKNKPSFSTISEGIQADLDFASIEKLMIQSKNLDEKDSNGLTSLHYAVE